MCMLKYLEDWDFILKLLFLVAFFSFTEAPVTLANNYKEILDLMKPHGKIPTDFNGKGFAVLVFMNTRK